MKKGEKQIESSNKSFDIILFKENQNMIAIREGRPEDRHKKNKES